ncbi:hypothetical protein BASA81_003495 [Batrachochytrium salamandrivorans]|nr:hypothetical protein BASA81_003495 [Batrachochytrium salamandrivorans]
MSPHHESSAALPVSAWHTTNPLDLSSLSAPYVRYLTWGDTNTRPSLEELAWEYKHTPSTIHGRVLILHLVPHATTLELPSRGNQCGTDRWRLGIWRKITCGNPFANIDHEEENSRQAQDLACWDEGRMQQAIDTILATT